MSDSRIGRVLVASLHQAIAEVLPNRLEFYENWLSVPGLREGTIGLAPLSAVLSFLRGEGDAYDAIVRRAGGYAADWTFSSMSGLERRVVSSLPPALRSRGALRAGSALVRSTYGGSRAIVRVRKGAAAVDLRGSLFCEVRDTAPHPLCGFYAAALGRMLEHFTLAANAVVSECRGVSGGKGCRINVTVGGTVADAHVAAA